MSENNYGIRSIVDIISFGGIFLYQQGEEPNDIIMFSHVKLPGLLRKVSQENRTLLGML